MKNKFPSKCSHGRHISNTKHEHTYSLSVSTNSDNSDEVEYEQGVCECDIDSFNEEVISEVDRSLICIP